MQQMSYSSWANADVGASAACYENVLGCPVENTTNGYIGTKRGAVLTAADALTEI